MNRFLTIVCFLLLLGNGIFFFSNLWKASHGQPEIAQFAGINAIGFAAMYVAISILAVKIED